MLRIEGMDKIQRKLDALTKNAKAMDGQHVPVTELLTPAFVSAHTRFTSADELFEQSGFKIESPDDFTAIPDAEWDNYIRSISSFSGWKAMLSEAAGAWTKKRLGI